MPSILIRNKVWWTNGAEWCEKVLNGEECWLVVNYRDNTRFIIATGRG